MTATYAGREERRTTMTSLGAECLPSLCLKMREWARVSAESDPGPSRDQLDKWIDAGLGVLTGAVADWIKPISDLDAEMDDAIRRLVVATMRYVGLKWMPKN